MCLCLLLLHVQFIVRNLSKSPFSAPKAFLFTLSPLFLKENVLPLSCEGVSYAEGSERRAGSAGLSRGFNPWVPHKRGRGR